MSVVDLKMFEYYTTGKYKGFLLKETEILDDEERLKRLVFTNGTLEVSAIGRFQEEALLTIFSQIDRCLEKNDVSSYVI